MCGTCWSEVPGHLQNEVYRTWRAWRRNTGDGDALVAYDSACDAAIGAIA
jgi:hypothetical protein